MSMRAAEHNRDYNRDYNVARDVGEKGWRVIRHDARRLFEAVGNARACACAVLSSRCRCLSDVVDASVRGSCVHVLRLAFDS
eukprot:478910-Pyramimonas_sp.AAC.1